ncbi:MAG TPA: SRPBCC family protein [Trueperaceae bacterium]|nr:SRPBCC family protein [Trueperaceae bacterium]
MNRSASEAPEEAPEGAGQLTQLPNGGYRVTFVRHYERPVEDLWEAITSPEGLDAWYPTKLRHEGVVGSKVTENFESVDGTPPPEAPDGVITAFDPPNVFEMRIDGPAESEYPGMRGTQVIRMEARDGELTSTSELTFVHDLETKESALDVLPGWHWCLEMLALQMGSQGDASKEHHERLREYYKRTFG